jgi:solute:Na+ symporter, SSS family
MNDPFSSLNWIVLAAYLLVVLAIGIRARRHQNTTEDFFLAGRSMGWIPIGMSLCVTHFSAISYLATANQSYYFGMVLVGSVLPILLYAPLICLVVIPFFYNLRLYTIYEYLERRYSLSVRITGTMVFFMWRVMYLAIVLYAPCFALHIVLELAMQRSIPVEALIILVGVFSTLYTFLGGIRAVIWSDVAQFIVMFGSVAAMIIVVWIKSDSGPSEVWEIVSAGGRDVWFHTEFDLSDNWCLWGVIPFSVLATLSFYSADQINAQRFLTARSLRAAQKAFLVKCVATSILTPLLAYVGLNLYAFYQVHPERVPAQFNPAATATADPWPRDYKNPQSGAKLEDKILPTFVARELPAGVAGLVISALLAACMSTMDSGLNSAATSLLVDFHRRLGFGKQWLARKRGKTVEELDEADELTLARPLVIGIGIFATAFGCVVGHLGTIFEIARTVVDTPGIPLACVFLLGMITHRTNTVGALTGMVVGIATIIWLTLDPVWTPTGQWYWEWLTDNPQPFRMAAIYPGIVGAAVTMIVSYSVSLVVGKRKTREELRGLALRTG